MNSTSSAVNLSADVNDGVAVVQVDGRIDTTTASEFEQGLQELFVPDNRIVVLDFRGVGYVSSAGLRAILLLAKTAQEADCVLKISGMSADVLSIFEVTGFQNVVPIFADVAAALNG